MKKLFIFALILIAIGGVLLTIAHFSPDYVDEDGWLIEPFAERVIGGFLTLLGGLIGMITSAILWTRNRSSRAHLPKSR